MAGSTTRRRMVQHPLIGRCVALPGESYALWIVTGALREPGRGSGFAFRLYRHTCAGVEERWTGWRPTFIAIEQDGTTQLLQTLAALAGVVRRCMPDVPWDDRATDDEWDSALAAAEAVLAAHEPMGKTPCAP